MALSGVRDQAETVRDVVSSALEELFIVVGNETADDADMAKGLRRLRLMLRTWGALGPRLWLETQQSVTLVAGTSTYTLSPRVTSVFDAERRSSANNDTPMRILSREEYNRLPNKTATGAPYALWPDRQYDQTQVTVYPVPQTGTTDTLQLGVREVIQDVTELTENVHIPPEWSECVVLNLAVRLAPTFEAQVNPVTATLAQELYESLSGQDREGSVIMRARRH